MKTTRLVGFSLLLAYLAAMIAFTLSGGTLIKGSQLTAFEALGGARMAKWGVQFLAQIIAELIRFFPVGFLVPFLFPTTGGLSRRFFIRVVLVFPITLLLMFGLKGLELGKPWEAPGSSDMFLPFVSAIFGVWMGSNWVKGRSARLWLIPKLFLFGGILIGAAIYVASYGTESSALEIPSSPLTTTDKQDLWAKVQHARETAKKTEGNPTVLDFTEKDLSDLLKWLLSIYPFESKSQVTVSGTTLNTQVSMKLPAWHGYERHLNFLFGAQTAIGSDRFEFNLTGLRLGGIEAPEWSLGPISFLTRNFLRYDRRLGPVIAAAERVEIHPSDRQIMIAYREDRLKTELAGLFGGGTSPELLASAQFYVDKLLEISSTLSAVPKDEGIAAVLRALFPMARERSRAMDPVIENKAIIIALNEAYGDVGLSRLVGFNPGEITRRQLRERLPRPTVFGHANWSENFFTAAAVTAIANETAGEAVSTLKEELDQDSKQTSGQISSFADLFSRKVGIRFAEFATQEGRTARALQDRLSGAFAMEDLYPNPTGFNEDVRGDSNLTTAAGKTHGKVYDANIADMDSRLKRARIYLEP